MPAFMYDYQKEPKEEKHVRIVCTADPTKVYDILKGAYERAVNIGSCEGIISGGSAPPPWWYKAAMDFLHDLYHAKKVTSEAARIAKKIQSFVIEEDGAAKISYGDMRKIADAMCWIHQNRLHPDKKDGLEFYHAVSFIKNKTYRYTRLRG